MKPPSGGGDAFLVVDVQNDFVTGSMAIPGAESVIEPVNAAARAAEHVIVVTDWHPPGHVSFASSHPGARPFDVVEVPYGTQAVYADHCVQGTPGAELDPRLRLDMAELVFRKGHRRDVDSYGAFYENDGRTRTGLAEYLRARGIRRLHLSGLALYGCVAQTALGAVRDGFEVTVVREAAIGGITERTLDMRARLDEAGVRWASLAEYLSERPHLSGRDVVSPPTP